MNHSLLRYSDERDRTYGIAGMVIILVATNREDLLAEVHLDGDPAECLVMTHDYGFRGNPRMSAKIIWAQSVKDLRATASMVLANVACRRYVASRCAITPQEATLLRNTVRSEAMEHCGLDADEADALYDNCREYVNRVFRHSGVQEIAHTFADRLISRRNLSAAEAVEILAQLGLR